MVNSSLRDHTKRRDKLSSFKHQSISGSRLVLCKTLKLI